MNSGKLLRVNIQTFVLSFIGSLVLLIGPSSAAGQGGAANSIYLPLVQNRVNPIISETTEVLSPSTTELLAEVSNDGALFTFSALNNELESLEPGDIIVGDSTSAAPFGFLRKVESVSTGGNQVVVDTVAATLEEVIEQGDLSLSRRLTPADVDSIVLADGVTFASTGVNAPNLNDTFFYDLNNVVLYDEDGNLNTKNDQLKANGSLNLAPAIDFGFLFQNRSLQELKFVLSVEEMVELEFFVEVELIDVEAIFEIARLRFSPITVFVGPVPVVFLVEMPIYIRADGSVEVGLTTSVTQDLQLVGGLRYDDNEWKPVAGLDNSFDFELPRPSAGAELKGYIDPPLTLLLYGVAGPFAGANPYLEIKADLFADPWWELYAGIDVTAGVKAEVLGRSLGNHTEKVIGYRVLLASAESENQPPIIDPDSAQPRDGADNQPLRVVLGWSASDPDGNSVTYDVLLDAANPNPSTLICNDIMSSTCEPPGTLLPNTDYYWQVIATDTEDATTESPIWTFRTSAAQNVAPDEPHTPTPEDGAVLQEIDVILRWLGSDPDGDDVFYDVFLEEGDSTPDNRVCQRIATAVCAPPTQLAYDTRYFWQVVATDVHGSTTSSSVWEFETRSDPANNQDRLTLDDVIVAEYKSELWGIEADFEIVSKQSVRPGEPVKMFFVVTNHTNEDIPVIIDWEVTDPSGTRVDYLTYEGYSPSVPPGEWPGYWANGIGADAASGQYTLRISIRYDTQTVTKTESFTVSGSPIPLQVKQLWTALCDTYDNYYVPLAIQSSFDATDGHVCIIAEWWGVSEGDTGQWDWYKPDGSFYWTFEGQIGYDSASLWQWASWIHSSELSANPGSWQIDIFGNGVFEATATVEIQSSLAGTSLSTPATKAVHRGGSINTPKIKD